MKNCYPYIEGLRGIAILAIVLCHADVPLFRGGFVGVDIFFVLAGFLVTGLVNTEITQTGSVNFLDFSIGRLKCLFPALAFMLLVSCLAAAIILPSHLQPAEAVSAAYAFVWLSNFHFASTNVNYFDDPGINLFLHTWYPSVVAQFYLAWSLLIILVRPATKSLCVCLLAVFVISLVVSVTLSTIDPAWGFYSIHSRAWQFALGGIVALPETASLSGKFRIAQSASGFIGLLLIGTSIVLINDNMTYPGIAALAPSVGAALLLLAGAARAPVVSFLSSAPLQLIGRFSYSWYLWHWPVLVLGSVAFYRPGIGFQLLLVAISLALAVITYQVIEKPIAENQTLSAKPFFAAGVFLLLMAAGVLFANKWQTIAS